MWETSRFRGNNNGKGGANGGNGGGKRRGILRMKRVQAELVANNGWGVAGTVVVTRLILNDLGPKSVTLFSSASLELGQQVTFSIEHPRPLVVRGKITYNALFELTSRIHCNPRYPYRIQVEFDFLNDGEAAAVREYVEELNRNELAKAG
jgi:hypothetical protein